MVSAGRIQPNLARNDADLEEAAKQLLFVVCEGFCCSALVHVSDAVGSRLLERTYDEVLAKNQSVNFKLIDLAIRLDHFDAFPKKQLEALHKELQGSLLSHSLLRHLVWRHLYLFEVNYKLRSSVCTLLEIKQTPRLTTGKSRK